MNNSKNGKIDINELIKKAAESRKKGEMNTNDGINKFINSNLNEHQAKAVKDILSDERKTRELLNSDAAKALYDKFFGGGNNG